MPEARFTWTSAHTARIVTGLRVGQVVSWQEAFSAGWHARAGGKEIPILRDALGMMTIYPAEGPCVIELVYDGGIEMRVAQWVSGLTAVGLLGWVVVGRHVILKKSW